MIDDCDTSQTAQSNLNRARGPFTNVNGEFNLDQVDKFAEELAQSILEERQTNPEVILFNRYGDSFYDSNKALNGSIKNRLIGSGALAQYPDLASRWDKGNISTLETALFLENANLTPQGLIDKSNDGGIDNLAFQLDAYYKNSFTQSIMGGFCSSLPGLFGAIDAFFDIIDKIDGLIDDAISFLNKIKNYEDPLKAAIEGITVQSLLKKIKELVTESITKIFDKIMSAIENFNIENIIGDINTFVREDVIKRIVTAKERMCLFFNDENKKKIQNKVKGLIDYITGIFDSPGIQEIQFMLTKFCSLIGQIEGLMNDIKKPLDTFGGKYSRISNRLQRISNINTSSAVRAGAIRFSNEKKKEVINTIEEDWESEASEVFTPTGEKPVNAKPPTLAEYGKLPKCKAVKNGSEPRVKISGDWVDDEDCGLEGWVNIDVDLKVYLMRVQSEVGGQLNVISGYRSQQYNAKIGGAAESSHMTGLVIDIEPVKDSEAFAKIALTKGFKTVKVYSDRIHLSIQPRPAA